MALDFENAMKKAKEMDRATAQEIIGKMQTKPPTTGASVQLPSITTPARSLQYPYQQRQSYRDNTQNTVRVLDNKLKEVGNWVNATNPISKILAVPDTVENLVISKAQEVKDTVPEPFKKLVEAVAKRPTTGSAIGLGAQQTKAQSIANLKEGKGAGGQLAVDIAAGAGELAGDIILTTATGMPISALYGITGGAQTAQASLDEGYGANKALAAGTAAGAITSQVERLGGVGGNLGAQWLGKAAKTKAGQALLSKAPKVVEHIGKLSQSGIGKVLGSALSESVEEGTEYELQRIVNNLLLDKDTPYDVKEQLYQAVVGGAVGGLFGGTNAALDALSGRMDKSGALPIADDGVTVSESHTAEMQKIIADYNEAVDDGVVAFAEKVQSLKDKNVASKLNLRLGEVNDRQAMDIKNATGVDTSGFANNMNGSAVSHISKRHGLTGEADHSMSNVDDIGRISYVLKNYDTMEPLLDKTGNPGVSYAYLNPDGKPSPMVRISKRVNGTYYVIEAVPDTSAKKLQVITAYLENAKKEAPQVVDVFTPTYTSENGLASASLDTNIAQGNSGVNTQSAQEETGNTVQGSMTTKARNLAGDATRRLSRRVESIFSVPKGASRQFVVPQLEQMTNEYLATGRIFPETKAKAFSAAFDRGVVIDTEFYNQYKDLKTAIKAMPLTLSEQDRNDVGDYVNFKKANRHLITIDDKAGQPVDSYYTDLAAQYPELFPSSITHPADQLKRIAEVSESIRKVEHDLVAYHGEDSENYRQWARNDFDNAVNDMMQEAQLILRMEQDKAFAKGEAEAKKNAVQPELSLGEVLEQYKQLAIAERKAARAVSKHALTAEDSKVVEGLLQGYYQDVPEGHPNAKAIREVYRSKVELRALQQAVRYHKESVSRKYNYEADLLLEGSEQWKDKLNGFAASTNTMERNMFDIVGDDAKAREIIDKVFLPVKENEAAATRMKNALVKRVKALNIDDKVQYQVLPEGFDKPIEVTESGLVQLLGEKKITAKQIRSLGVDQHKIMGAVSELRNIYDKLFDAINDAYVRNGYKPMEKRGDYFPHFSNNEAKGRVARVLNSMGARIIEDSLPTEIAGRTQNFKPGRRWLGNALRRYGDKTEYDALEGLERYLDSAAEVIHHTDDLQRVRALERRLRTMYSRGGVDEQMQTLKDDPTLTDDERIIGIAKLAKTDMTHLSNLAVEMGRYADALAGKKNISDRDWEQKLGRGMYNMSQFVEGRIAANMIGFNLSSALTNVIPLTQATAEIPPQHLLQGMKETVQGLDKTDGFAQRSTFLTNRKGVEHLKSAFSQKVSDIGGMPMQAVDDFTSEAIVRARYHQNIARGYQTDIAMKEANRYAGQLMADRSKGSLPTIFNEKNPLTKMVTMFQVEVNNQYQYLVKDLPRNLRENLPEDMIKREMLKGIMSYMLGAFLYNELYEFFVGRRAAFDPLGIAVEAYGDFASDDVSTATALGNLGGNLAQEVPFVGGLLGGGRVPISSALVDPQVVAKNVGGMLDGTVTPAKGWGELGGELAGSAALLLPPAGGNQLKKTVQGLQAHIKGGAYKKDNNGEEQLQFLVERNPLTLLQSAAFGKWSTSGAREYVDNGFKAMSVKDTYGMKRAETHGIPADKYWEVYQATRRLTSDKDTEGKTITLSKDKKTMNEIAKLMTGYTATQKMLMYDIFGISKKLW